MADDEVKLTDSDGVGENRRGPFTTPTPLPPGEGDNERQSPRAENIPFAFGSAVPAPAWKDSGVPGLFIRPESPFYELPKQILNYAEIEYNLVFTLEEEVTPELVQIKQKIRFTQKIIIDNLRVQSSKILNLDTIKSVKMLYVSCISGVGNVILNGDTILPMQGRDPSFDFDLPGIQHSTYLYFNYKGGVTSISFNGDLTVYIAIFA